MFNSKDFDTSANKWSMNMSVAGVYSFDLFVKSAQSHSTDINLSFMNHFPDSRFFVHLVKFMTPVDIPLVPVSSNRTLPTFYCYSWLTAIVLY